MKISCGEGMVGQSQNMRLAYFFLKKIIRADYLSSKGKAKSEEAMLYTQTRCIQWGETT